MPYLYTGRTNKAFLVERSVGSNGYNEKEDVKLVQYLLANIYTYSLPVNGVANAQTVNMIMRFQRDMLLRGHKVRMDGRVDSPTPVGGGKVLKTSTLSQTTYTMVLLNEELRAKNKAALERVPQVVKLNPNPSPYAFSKDP